MKDRAYAVLGLALLTSLALLARIAPGGELSLGGAATILLLGALTAPEARRHRRGLLWDLALVLGPVLAAAIGVTGLLEVALATHPPPGLAWFARVLCLGAAVLLYRTPPQALVLHGLVVVLALWTASALRGGVEPGVAAITVLAMAVTSYGLLLARSCEQRSTAESSLSVGVAPIPWGLRRPWLPALGVVLLTLVPFALGLRLPRPGASAGERRTTPARAEAARAPSARRVEFTTELRLDLGHGDLEHPNQRVAVVDARPAPEALYLRGAALTHATDAGFRIPRAPLPEPRPAESVQEILLEVTLLRREQGYLFALGQPVGFDVRTRARPEGVLAADDASYPLSYAVRCAVPDSTLDPRDLQPLRAPALLELPAAIREDPALHALTDSIAWQPSAHLRAAAVMRWLAENARYDGRHAVSGHDLHQAVRAFLLESRRGICVEFATAAAVLLRLAEVPTRVVTGYRTHERDGDSFVVRARHAHAWVEVAFDGAGWVPYDPTPGLEVQQTSAAKRATSAAQQSPPPSAWTRLSLEGLVPPGWPVWTLPAGVLALAWLSLILWLASRYHLRHSIRRAQLGRDAASTSAVLLGDRARFFALLSARGFDLEGAQTPAEWLAAHDAVLPPEPGLNEAIGDYAYLRFSGREPPERVEAFRRSLRRLARQPAAADRRDTI